MPNRLNIDRLKREMGLVTWDEFYFNILSQVSSRSNSEERRQGAIIIKNNTIIAIGCFDAYEKKNSQEQKKEGEKERVIGSGAIENALATCANNGVSTNNATLFTYTFPNDIVCKLLIKAGISEIKYIKSVDSVLGKELCNKMNIKLTQFPRS